MDLRERERRRKEARGWGKFHIKEQKLLQLCKRTIPRNFIMYILARY
jgi:hypothetical protein